MAGNDLNSVAIVGRLTRDAEVRYLQSGTAVASLSVAVNRSRKDGDQWVSEVNYFDVSYFSKSVESLRPYLTKGKQIAVQGSLKQDRWEKDGQKFSKVQIVASGLMLLGDSGGGGSGSSAPFEERKGFSPPGSAVPGGEFPEDIPF